MIKSRALIAIVMIIFYTMITGYCFSDADTATVPISMDIASTSTFIIPTTEILLSPDLDDESVYVGVTGTITFGSDNVDGFDLVAVTDYLKSPGSIPLTNPLQILLPYAEVYMPVLEAEPSLVFRQHYLPNLPATPYTGTIGFRQQLVTGSDYPGGYSAQVTISLTSPFISVFE